MNKLLKVIISEDEAPGRILLRTYIQNLAPQFSIESECKNLPNGIKAIRKYKPDLVFLDIEMPGHSGLGLLDFFSEDEVNFDIIFTTGYSEFAIKAFKLSAFDYLLKPIDEEELLGAIQRSIKKVTYGQQNIAQLKQELGSIGSGRIAVPLAGSIKFIELTKVLFLK